MSIMYTTSAKGYKNIIHSNHFWPSSERIHSLAEGTDKMEHLLLGLKNFRA
jgi:hypothetical protein